MRPNETVAVVASSNVPTVVDVTATPNHLLPIRDAEVIAEHLRQGGVAIVPTDTGYMLAVDALREKAIDKVYEVKGRPAENPIHVVVSSIAMARELVHTAEAAERAMNAFLPGPVTVICPKRDLVSDRLVADTGNLGIRIPDSPIPVMLAGLAGTPLTATSLNLSGQSPVGHLDQLLGQLLWAPDDLIYVVHDPGLTVLSQPSTVVTFATEPWKVLREGPISREQIAAVSGE